MAFVISKEDGERRRVPYNDLDAVIRAGLAVVDPEQTVIMEDSEGNIVNASGPEYEKIIAQGGRTLKDSEYYNLIENRRKAFKYTRPGQKTGAIFEGAIRGIDLGANEWVRGLAGFDREEIRARQYFNAYSAGAAELATGIFGAGKLKLLAKGAGAALKAGKMGAVGKAIAKPVGAGFPLPAVMASSAAEAAMRRNWVKNLAKKGAPKDASRLLKILGPTAPIAVQGAVEAGVSSALYSAFRNSEEFIGDPMAVAGDILLEGGLGLVFGGVLGTVIGASPAGKDIIGYLGNKAGQYISTPSKALGDIAVKVTDDLAEATPKTITQIVEEGKHTPEKLVELVEQSAEEFGEKATSRLVPHVRHLAEEGRDELGDLSYGRTGSTRQRLADDIEPGGESFNDLEPNFNDEVFYEKASGLFADVDDLASNPLSYGSKAMRDLERKTGGATKGEYSRGVEEVVDEISGKTTRQRKRGVFEDHLEAKNNPLKVALFHAYKRLNDDKAYDTLIGKLQKDLKKEFDNEDIRGIVKTFKEVTTSTKVIPGKIPRIFEEHKAVPSRNIKYKDKKKVEALGEGPSPILKKNPSAPAKLFRAVINGYDSARNAMYDSTGGRALDGIDGANAELRLYFENIYYSTNMFGSSAANIKEFNEAWDLYKHAQGQVLKALADQKSPLGHVIKEGLLPGTKYGEIPEEAVLEIIKKARRGDPKAKEIVAKFEELARINQAYIDRITPFYAGDTAGLKRASEENIKAINGFQDTLNLSRLVEGLSPTAENPLLNRARNVAVALAARRNPKKAGALALASFLGTSALASPVLAAGLGVGPFLVYKGLQALTTPYRQLKRVASVKALRDKAEKSKESAVKKIRKSLGKKGESPSKAMEQTQFYSRKFVRGLMSYKIAQQDFENDRHAAIVKIKTLAADEALLDDMATKATISLSDFPALREASMIKIKGSIQKINTLTPPEILVVVDPITGEESVRGPDYAFDKVDQIYSIAQAPMKTLVSAVESGTFTDTLRKSMMALFPDEFSAVIADLQASLTGPGKGEKLTKTGRITFSKLTGVPTNSLTPMAISALQAAYQEEEKPESRRQRGLASLKKEADNTMTPSQRAMTA